MTPLQLVEIVREYDEELAEEIKRKTEENFEKDINDIGVKVVVGLLGMFTFGDEFDYWLRQHSFLASYLEGSSITYRS